MAGTNQEVAAMGNGNSPHLAMVTIQSLDLLEFITIPISDCAILAAAEEMVAVAVVVVRYEGDLKDTVLVPEESFVAVTEIKTPYSDVLVG